MNVSCSIKIWVLKSIVISAWLPTQFLNCVLFSILYWYNQLEALQQKYFIMLPNSAESKKESSEVLTLIISPVIYDLRFTPNFLHWDLMKPNVRLRKFTIGSRTLKLIDRLKPLLSYSSVFPFLPPSFFLVSCHEAQTGLEHTNLCQPPTC